MLKDTLSCMDYPEIEYVTLMSVLKDQCCYKYLLVHHNKHMSDVSIPIKMINAVKKMQINVKCIWKMK